jgi:hypothetical protein
MTFEPVLPWAILAVVIGALVLARLVALRQVLWVAARRGHAVLRWSGVTLAVLLLIAAAARPALHNDETRRGTTTVAGENLDVFLIVDRSIDSGVEDYGTGEPRVAGMRDDIAAMLKRYPAARYALISVAASRAELDWPLSEDVWSLHPVVAALRSQQGGPDAGFDANAAAAANVLRYQLTQATQQYPRARNVVLYFGSGVTGSRATQGDFDLTQRSVDGGAVLGYGSTDEAGLRQVAGQLGVPYLHRDSDRPFQPDLPDTPHGTGIQAEAVDRIELYWLPALLAAGLLLVEIYLSVREFRLRRIARRGLTQ